MAAGRCGEQGPGLWRVSSKSRSSHPLCTSRPAGAFPLHRASSPLSLRVLQAPGRLRVSCLTGSHARGCGHSLPLPSMPVASAPSLPLQSQPLSKGKLGRAQDAAPSLGLFPTHPDSKHPSLLSARGECPVASHSPEKRAHVGCPPTILRDASPCQSPSPCPGAAPGPVCLPRSLQGRPGPQHLFPGQVRAAGGVWCPVSMLTAGDTGPEGE